MTTTKTTTTITVRARGYEAAAIKAFKQEMFSMEGIVFESNAKKHTTNFYHKDNGKTVAYATVVRNEDKSFTVTLDSYETPEQPAVFHFDSPEEARREFHSNLEAPVDNYIVVTEHPDLGYTDYSGVVDAAGPDNACRKVAKAVGLEAVDNETWAKEHPSLYTFTRRTAMDGSYKEMLIGGTYPMVAIEPDGCWRVHFHIYPTPKPQPELPTTDPNSPTEINVCAPGEQPDAKRDFGGTPIPPRDAEPEARQEAVHREYENVTLEEIAQAMWGVPEAIFMYRPQIPDLVQKAATRGTLHCFKSYDLDGELHSYDLRVQANQYGCTPDRYNVQLDAKYTVTPTGPVEAAEPEAPEAKEQNAASPARSAEERQASAAAVDELIAKEPWAQDPSSKAALAREAAKTPEERAAENPLNGTYENTVPAKSYDQAVDKMMHDLGIAEESPREYEKVAPGKRIYRGTVTNVAGEQAPYTLTVQRWEKSSFYMYLDFWRQDQAAVRDAEPEQKAPAEQAKPAKQPARLSPDRDAARIHQQALALKADAKALSAETQRVCDAIHARMAAQQPADLVWIEDCKPEDAFYTPGDLAKATGVPVRNIVAMTQSGELPVLPGYQRNKPFANLHPPLALQLLQRLGQTA